MNKQNGKKNPIVILLITVLAIMTCVVGVIVVMFAVRMAEEEESDQSTGAPYMCDESNFKTNPYCGSLDKPVIYLYPQDRQSIEVKLSFQGEVFASLPNYLNGGWEVIAEPDGRIFHEGREYSYLFWEGRPDAVREYDWSTGFVVKGSEAREFLHEKLAEIGLTPREYNEFIVYWYPKMQENELNLVHFASYDEYDKYAELEIAPSPDAMLRVFMVYKKIDAPVEIEEQKFDKFERRGFTVVEWGGSEIK